MSTVFWGRKGVLMVELMHQVTTVMWDVYCETLKKLHRAIQNKKCGMLTSSVLLLQTMRVCIQLLALEHSWSISTGNCLTTLLEALISLRATTNCLQTWSTGWDHSASTTMRSWWKMSKCGWAHGQQTSLAQTYKTYSFIRKLPQFQQWLHWEVAHFLYIIISFSHCLFC
jgi:hypothetical protein